MDHTKQYLNLMKLLERSLHGMLDFILKVRILYHYFLRVGVWGRRLGPCCPCLTINFLHPIVQRTYKHDRIVEGLNITDEMIVSTLLIDCSLSKVWSIVIQWGVINLLATHTYDKVKQMEAVFLIV